MERREFIEKTSVALAALSITGINFAFSSSEMQYRVLGKTGMKVSLLGIGGHHIGANRITETESITVIRKAIDSGVTFMDNACCYHDGRSEERMGKALQDGYRDKVVLMTKHHGRDPESARSDLEKSLTRLKTDVIDVWQFHDIQSMDEVEKIHSSGVLDFAMKAKQEGKIKHIGFTGHVNPKVHKAMLKGGFEWETVQMPINPLDYHYLSFTQEIIPLLKEQNIGIIGMKSVASGRIVRNDIATIEECLNFTMSMPVGTLVSGIDNLNHLKQNMELAKNHVPMNEKQLAALLERTLGPSEGGKNEWYKKELA